MELARVLHFGLRSLYGVISTISLSLTSWYDHHVTTTLSFDDGQYSYREVRIPECPAASLDLLGISCSPEVRLRLDQLET